MNCETCPENPRLKNRLLLRIIQPSLVGLIDGSVSTLAPVFAAAAVTRSSRSAFLVGLAASIGAGVSMGFAEGLSDTGEITGRGSGWARGWVVGAATLVGGLGHTVPFLLSNYWTAWLTATIVVLFELVIIALIRSRYLGVSAVTAIWQTLLGGAIVAAVGVLIGAS